jgi:hypothetical protein
MLSQTRGSGGSGGGGRTEDKVPDGVVVVERPGDPALHEDLDAADPERVRVDLPGQIALAHHHLGRLPAQRAVCRNAISRVHA